MFHGNNPFDDILAPQPRPAVRTSLTNNPFGDVNEPERLDVGGPSQTHARSASNNGKQGLALDPFFDE
jgi:hypothetical protein